MGDRVWQIPEDEFVTAWNGADTLAAAAAKLRELANGNVPRWSAMGRAAALRKAGVPLKRLTASGTIVA